MKKLGKFLGLLSLLFLLAACNKEGKSEGLSSDNSDKKVKIGIVQMSEHVALDRSERGFEEEIKKEFPDAEIILKNASGDVTLIPSIVSAFQGQKCDLIYAIATPAAQGAKNIVKDIPIVFSAVTDPVSAGLVKDLEKPEGNITGVSDYISINMQLENFLELFPQTKNIGVLFSTNEVNSKYQIEELKKACQNLSIGVKEVGVNNINDVSQAMTSFKKDIDAFYALSDNLVASSAKVISERLIENKIPSFAAEEGPVENGILLSNGVDYLNLGRKAGEMAVQILKGSPVKDIPVHFSTESSKVCNEDSGKKLNLENLDQVLKDARLIK
ncbi:MAG: ABC transporter substrate-binding protein [Peptoniphilus lacrimalis]